MLLNVSRSLRVHHLDEGLTDGWEQIVPCAGLPIISSCLTVHSHPYLSVACALHPLFAAPSLDRLWSHGPGIADAMLQFVQRPPSLHLLPTFTADRRTGQSTAASVSRSRSAITAARQIEATSRFVPCANSPTPTTGTLTPA